MTWEEVCAIGSVLPLVEPGSYHGYPALRVAGKFLTRLGDDYDSLEFKAIDPDRWHATRALVKADRKIEVLRRSPEDIVVTVP